MANWQLWTVFSSHLTPFRFLQVSCFLGLVKTACPRGQPYPGVHWVQPCHRVREGVAWAILVKWAAPGQGTLGEPVAYWQVWFFLEKLKSTVLSGWPPSLTLLFFMYVKFGMLFFFLFTLPNFCFNRPSSDWKCEMFEQTFILSELFKKKKEKEKFCKIGKMSRI